MEKKEEEGIVGGRRRRAFPKKHVSFNNYSVWKHKLREKCCKRVKNDRSRLLWNLRLPTTTQEEHHHQFHHHSHNHNYNQQQFINSTFQRIVSDELRNIIPTPPPPLSAPLTHNHDDDDDDDMLWDYDALHAACPDECEAILFEMQRIFYQDLRLELDQHHTTTEPESCINTWEDEEDEYLARAVYEHMQLNEEQVQKKVWCPICKQGELQENCSHIYCSRCELKLNKEQEITLDLIRIRLADAHTEHLDGGCRMKPRFCIQSRFNLTALYMECQACSTFEVVI